MSLWLVSIAMLACLVTPIHAQTKEGDLHVFGYFQADFEHDDTHTGAGSTNSFILQQLNILAAKDIAPRFSTFVNLEVTNSYSSAQNWGTFSLDEAWVKYFSSNALNIKAGLMIPEFNNLNEIKDRTPLLPYIVRPPAYEDSYSDLIDLDALVPEQAYFQVYGFVPAGDLKIDYAVYTGNGDPSFANSSSGNFVVRGFDTTLEKMVGGRAGVRLGDFKAGASMVIDHQNFASLGLGSAERIRFGSDLSFRIGDCHIESEAIVVSYPLSSSQDAVLAEVLRSNPLVGSGLNKYFYYGNATYDISESVYAYAGVAYLRDDISPYLDDGIKTWNFGGGFRPANAIVLKCQFYKVLVDENPLTSVDQDRFLLAISVLF